MAHDSICDNCVKADVCDRKDIVKYTEYQIKVLLSKGVIKDNVVTFDNVKLSPSYDLHNRGISASVSCTRRLEEKTEEEIPKYNKI
jgi:hypothetical protein